MNVWRVRKPRRQNLHNPLPKSSPKSLGWNFSGRIVSDTTPPRDEGDIFSSKNLLPPTGSETYPKHSSRLLLSSENEPFKEGRKTDHFWEKNCPYIQDSIDQTRGWTHVFVLCVIIMVLWSPKGGQRSLHQNGFHWIRPDHICLSVTGVSQILLQKTNS